MNLVALMVADSRFPGGGHVHSGGLEEAVARRLVTDEASLASFLIGRLRTAGALGAVFAAAATRGRYEELDAELDARTPSPAQRHASRVQGRGIARAARKAWPSAALTELLRVTPRPHHPVIVGVLVGEPFEAAQAVAYHSVTGPATGAIRLLGLDPFGVNAALARLATEIDAVAGMAAEHADTPPEDLPAPSAPGLDLLAEAHDRHHSEEVRLFVS
ncbi:urease accessory protein UreF [Saccharothrix sp. NRRL B-16348]|uniref:urease accessory protein UreF n=1 Tax=Saccharothrix sp. NRRL B-16348 TaxID=1415542 RepID=UPI0006AF6391|nr:urease accessory UreF family protein [Saccharothrix sp. NRRL B-16348]KOX22613.1 urease accessory protein UreF [Saccharothrix sp. NRRL B-16348]